MLQHQLFCVEIEIEIDRGRGADAKAEVNGKEKVDH